jgi:hypothetical protein
MRLRGRGAPNNGLRGADNGRQRTDSTLRRPAGGVSRRTISGPGDYSGAGGLVYR